VLLGLAVLSACAAPDRPGRPRGIPPAALSLLRPDSVRTATIYPGVSYHYLWSPRGPWGVHVVEAGIRGRCDLAFEVLRPTVRWGGGQGRARVSEMVEDTGPTVLAAVNGDFFTPQGAPLGVEVVDGVVGSWTARPSFAWRAGADPWMGTAVSDGRAVLFGWPVDRRRGDGETEAIGGFPDLIDRGRRVGDLEVDGRPSFAAARHPRTAVGFDDADGTVWLVVVDGRQTPYSAGMTLPELASLFEALGVEEALNLDGGGSSALVLASGTMNRPSDVTGERPVVNALALVRKPSGCRF